MQGIQVDLKQIGKDFGTNTILNNVNLKIKKGEFLAIVGKSGCGKSTLLRIISGLEDPTKGDVYFDEDVQKGISSKARIMFQDPRLLPWKSVLDNVKLGINNKTAAQEALNNVGLEDKSAEWPELLSGGQKQRVALARALSSEPKLLLFDEPLGALDALTRIEMQQLIEKIWSKVNFTAILVTHDVAEAVALADRVILIEDQNIALDIQIDLPRPRERDDKFSNYEHIILQRILTKNLN